MKNLYCILTINSDDDEDLYEASFAIGKAIQEFNPHLGKELFCSLDPLSPEEVAEIEAVSKKTLETGVIDITDGAEHYLAAAGGGWYDLTPPKGYPGQDEYEKGSC